MKYEESTWKGSKARLYISMVRLDFRPALASIANPRDRFAEAIKKSKPNLTVLAEYRRREAEFLDRARDMEAVSSQRDAAKKRYDDLRKVRLDEFMAGFSAISVKLKEMYQVGVPLLFASPYRLKSL